MPIRRRRTGPTLVAVMLDPLFLHPHSCIIISPLLQTSHNEYLKERAAQPRGLKHFPANRPCRHGHMKRRVTTREHAYLATTLQLGPLTISLGRDSTAAD